MMRAWIAGLSLGLLTSGLTQLTIVVQHIHPTVASSAFGIVAGTAGIIGIAAGSRKH